MPWTFKITKMKPEVSTNSGCANFLTTNCVQELPEDELAIVSATKETKSKAVRVLIYAVPTTLTHA